MTVHISPELIQYLTLIKSDQALSASFRSNHSDFLDIVRDISKVPAVTNVKPIPGTGSITALEVAILDNWPKGKPIRGKPSRYGFSMNVSTTLPVDMKPWPFHFSGSLISGQEMINAADRLIKPKLLNPISESYRQFIVSIVDCYPVDDGHLFGMLQAKPPGEGTVYPEQHVLVVQTDETKVKLSVKAAFLWIGVQGVPLTLAPFVSHYAGHKPVDGKVVVQSRTATVPSMKWWKS